MSIAARLSQGKLAATGGIIVTRRRVVDDFSHAFNAFARQAPSIR
jgi:hypothetical protein